MIFWDQLEIIHFLFFWTLLTVYLFRRSKRAFPILGRLLLFQLNIFWIFTFIHKKRVRYSIQTKEVVGSFCRWGGSHTALSTFSPWSQTHT